MSRSLETFLRSARSVGYEPMVDEPDYTTFLSAFGLPGADFRIPASKDILPEDISQELRERFGTSNAALYIPGRRFDRAGTRHGRGHGWYDRLLSQLPEQWVRVGIGSPELLSDIALKRESWDEPMDYVVIHSNGEFEVIETRARGDVLQSSIGI